MSIVHGRSGIAGAISEVWGWTPSDTQITRWVYRDDDPIPAKRHAGTFLLRADENEVKRWAERNQEGAHNVDAQSA